MRRAWGAVVVTVVVGLWSSIDALLLRPSSTTFERAMSSEAPPALPPPVKFDPPRPATVTRTRSARDGLAGTSFRADPFAFLSTAPADSLDLLPGVGPVLAARIIDARALGAFTSWNDVLAVKGIGPATVARWRALAGQ